MTQDKQSDQFSGSFTSFTLYAVTLLGAVGIVGLGWGKGPVLMLGAITAAVLFIFAMMNFTAAIANAIARHKRKDVEK